MHIECAGAPVAVHQICGKYVASETKNFRKNWKKCEKKQKNEKTPENIEKQHEKQ